MYIFFKYIKWPINIEFPLKSKVLYISHIDKRYISYIYSLTFILYTNSHLHIKLLSQPPSHQVQQTKNQHTAHIVLKQSMKI